VRFSAASTTLIVVVYREVLNMAKAHKYKKTPQFVYYMGA
jgi:hypothetical protein